MWPTKSHLKRQLAWAWEMGRFSLLSFLSLDEFRTQNKQSRTNTSSWHKIKPLVVCAGFEFDQCHATIWREIQNQNADQLPTSWWQEERGALLHSLRRLINLQKKTAWKRKLKGDIEGKESSKPVIQSQVQQLSLEQLEKEVQCTMKRKKKGTNNYFILF